MLDQASFVGDPDTSDAEIMTRKKWSMTITSTRPAGELVRDIMQEAEDLLHEGPRTLLG